MSEERQRVPNLGDLEALSYIPQERLDFKRKTLTAKINEIIRIFERDTAGVVDVREVGTILRAMNINPTEAELLEMVEKVEESESVGFVKSQKLHDLLLDMLINNEFNKRVLCRDSEETILKAFEVLDRDNKGYIPSEYLKDLMTSMGERFNADEIMEMLNAATDPETGNVYYEEFAAVLAEE